MSSRGSQVLEYSICNWFVCYRLVHESGPNPLSTINRCRRWADFDLVHGLNPLFSILFTISSFAYKLHTLIIYRFCSIHNYVFLIMLQVIRHLQLLFVLSIGSTGVGQATSIILIEIKIVNKKIHFPNYKTRIYPMHVK